MTSKGVRQRESTTEPAGLEQSAAISSPNRAQYHGEQSELVRGGLVLAMPHQPDDYLEAEVLLRPADERAARGELAANARSVRHFEAPPQTVEAVARKLRECGFTVTATSPTSISIAGSSALFAQVFQAKLDAPSPRASELSVPEELQEQVQGVYLQTPPTYFGP
jgi:hypothetical protein